MSAFIRNTVQSWTPASADPSHAALYFLSVAITSCQLPALPVGQQHLLSLRGVVATEEETPSVSRTANPEHHLSFIVVKKCVYLVTMKISRESVFMSVCVPVCVPVCVCVGVCVCLCVSV